MPPNSQAPASGLRDALIAAVLFGVCLAIYWISPISYVGDSKYTLLLTQTLLSKHSFMLDEYAGPPTEQLPTAAHPLNGNPYQTERARDGHLYYYMPSGGSVLAAPFVFVGNLLGKKIIHRNGTYNIAREEKNQLFIAALLMAILAVIFYFTGRLLLPPGWSACIALGGALGTQIWSTATRSLCSQTWGCLLIGLAVYMALAQETGRRRLQPIWLATCLSWAYFVRPTSSIVILGFTVYVLWFHRRQFLAFAATGAAWAAAFVCYSEYHFGTILPAYYAAARLHTDTFFEALAGNLISPSRGLFVYVPVTLFVGYLIVRFWRERCHPRLIWLAAAVFAVQVVAVSSFPHWWGGDSFGPRFTTELVPWLTLLAILGVAAARRWREATVIPRSVFAWRTTLATGTALLLLSGWINGRGATSEATYLWNGRPAPVDAHPDRLWQWRYPQVLAGILDVPGADVFPVLPVGKKALFGNRTEVDYRLSGWADSEPEHTWSEAPRAAIIFATDARPASTLRLCFGAFISSPHVIRQHVTIRLNDQQIAALVVATPEAREYSFDLPPGTLRAKNTLTFDLPDVVPASSVAATDDPRALGIALLWIQLDGPAPATLTK